MLFVKLLRFSKGYVRFTATGVFLERFLNMAVRRGINVWDAAKKDDVLTACTDVRSYKLLRPFAKKTGVRLRVRERHGAPFEARRYRKRTGLLVGVVLFLAFLCVMGQFIWHVEVQGNEEMSSAEVLTTLSELGLHSGVWSGSLDVRELERSALLRMQKLSWIAVNLDGSTATIEVRERTMPPQMYPDDDKPCNIVAAREGLITYMEVYEGQAVLKVGDTVQEGDMIVSGIIEDKKGQDTVKHARAKVLAQADCELTVQVPRTETVKEMTGEQKHRRYLRVFGADLPLFIYRPYSVAYEFTRETKPLTLLGMPLPLSYVDETYRFYVENQRVLPAGEARERALLLLEEQEKVVLAGGKIVEKIVEHTELDDVHKVTGKYLCNIDIALEQEFSINE